MKTRNKKFSYFPFVLIFVVFISCENNSEQIENLTNENAELSDNYQSQLIESRSVTKTADSL